MAKINLGKVRTVSIRDRKSKVFLKDFARVKNFEKIPPKAAEYFLEAVPDINFGRNFKDLVGKITEARKKKKAIIFMFGAHVLKCGLSPVLGGLMKKGFITFLATNGASLIHDYELARFGATSEFVDDAIQSGDFGVTGETLEGVNAIASRAARGGAGLGETAGDVISGFDNASYSLFAVARGLKVPATVHVAIGTDIVCQSRHYDAASWGKASYADFLKLAEELPKLTGGGVVLNFGSAVMLPEVFLKAINLSRNLGNRVEGFTAANFDMIRQYRPLTNIISRPVAKGGTGYNFAGFHEITLPLLYMLLDGKK